MEGKMGGHLGVVSPAMKAYSQKAESAGARIGGIELASHAAQVGSALPGATAGGAATGCSLNQDVPDWGKAIAKQGGNVGSANESYGANESAGSDLFGGLLGGH